MSYLAEKQAELEQYLPPLTKKTDFDDFWHKTIALAKNQPLHAEKKQVASPLPYAKVFDISYCGFDETPVHGWLILPTHTAKKNLPCLIHYPGFGGNRGFAWDFSTYILAGMAVLTLDVREQSGITGNAAQIGGMVNNLSTKGLSSPENYYFRAVYMDCVKAIDFLEQCPEIDNRQIVVAGGSQGGALTMAVACLDNRPLLAIADVPSNGNLQVRVEGSHGSFGAIQDYLRIYPDETDRVFDVLSYFDLMNMADKITCPVFASVALMDNICPAKCYFAAYNRISSDKEIFLYPFNGHEGGGSLHMGRKLSFLQKHGLIG